jgi:neutral ceramidase
MMECGLYEIDITPPMGYAIPGYFTPRPALGIKDNLYVKAVVIGDGHNFTAIIVLDTIGIEKEEVDAIRNRVTEATEIPASHILVAGTHTHTGGPIYRDRDSNGDEYTAYLVKKASDAAVLAYGNKRKAQIGFAKGKAEGISFNRRYFMQDGNLRTNPGFNNPDIVKPAGPTDSDVFVIRLDAEDGSPLGVITNFACHPDTIGGKRYSADFPGEISRVLKAVYGESFISLFLNGACGNINHLDFMHKVRPEPDAFRQLGRVLAGEVIKTREKAIKEISFHVEGRSKLLSLNVRNPSPEDLSKAKELIRASEHPENKKEITEADIFFAKQLLALSERQETEVFVEIQALRIGASAIAAFPCELFVEFGHDLKQRSPSPHTLIATYANGVNGYVATREAFVHGGYETRLTSRTRLAPDSGEQMVDTALGLLQQLCSSDGGINIE